MHPIMVQAAADVRSTELRREAERARLVAPATRRRLAERQRRLEEVRRRRPGPAPRAERVASPAWRQRLAGWVVRRLAPELVVVPTVEVTRLTEGR